MLAEHLVPVQKQILDWSGKTPGVERRAAPAYRSRARDPVCRSAGRSVPRARHRIRKRSTTGAG
jgi:hypothetical protein